MIDLLESQGWKYQQLRDLQTERMRIIVRYAYENLRGYREKYDAAGVNINDIKELEDLPKLPVLTRVDLRDIDKWVIRDKIRCTLHTGGTTGEPLTYYESKVARALRSAKHNRGWLWSGFDKTKDKRVILFSQRAGAGKGARVLNITGAPEEANIRKILDMVKEFQPKQLRAYGSSVWIVADWIRRNNYDIKISSLNLTAEQITKMIREDSEKAFQSTVFEEYCCCDGAASAWDCELHCGTHETMERAIIERGPEGELIVTDMWNEAMPFIRYLNGDGVERIDEPCPCGRELPIIKVSGRMNDFIDLPSGPLPPIFLYHHVSHVRVAGGGFIDFVAIQYVQTTKIDIDVNIVRGSGYNKEDERALRRTVEDICKGLTVHINYVPSLEKSKAGKIRFIINKTRGQK